jgi:hypothetical protein
MKLIDRQDDSKLLNICHTTTFFSLNPQQGRAKFIAPLIFISFLFMDTVCELMNP